MLRRRKSSKIRMEGKERKRRRKGKKKGLCVCESIFLRDSCHDILSDALPLSVYLCLVCLTSNREGVNKLNERPDLTQCLYYPGRIVELFCFLKIVTLLQDVKTGFGAR